MIIPRLVALALLSLSVPALSAAPADDVRAEKLDRRLHRLARGARPGFAAMVIRGDEIVFSGGYGLGNLEKETPLTPKSTFRLASVSKQFTAMAIMILEEKGKLEYTDPVSKFLKDSIFDGITVEHLLHHTGGLADYMELTEASWDKSKLADNEDIVALYVEKKPEPRFAPGERWSYSNTGYAFLASIVEVVTGERFETFVKREIFDKLGMKSSLVVSAIHPVKIPNRVLGYRRQGPAFKSFDFHYLNGIVGDGAVYTTLEDYFLWDQALYTDKVVSRKTIERAFTPVRLRDGKQAKRSADARQGYGYGWQIRTEDGKKIVSHGGSWVGFRTFVERHIEDRTTFVVFANTPDVDLQGALGIMRGLYRE